MFDAKKVRQAKALVDQKMNSGYMLPDGLERYPMLAKRNPQNAKGYLETLTVAAAFAVVQWDEFPEYRQRHEDHYRFLVKTAKQVRAAAGLLPKESLKDLTRRHARLQASKAIGSRG